VEVILRLMQRMAELQERLKQFENEMDQMREE
jgi:hypothetical protein